MLRKVKDHAAIWGYTVEDKSTKHNGLTYGTRTARVAGIARDIKRDGESCFVCVQSNYRERNAKAFLYNPRTAEFLDFGTLEELEKKYLADDMRECAEAKLRAAAAALAEAQERYEKALRELEALQ